MSDKNKRKREAWRKRKRRIRLKVEGTAERPRLTVWRSNKFIYAQVVDDLGEPGATFAGSQTMLACSSVKPLDHEVPEDLRGKCGQAYQVGRQLAEQIKDKGIQKVIFDRNGYLYHGRVAALARGVRDGGIEF